MPIKVSDIFRDSVDREYSIFILLSHFSPSNIKTRLIRHSVLLRDYNGFRRAFGWKTFAAYEELL